MTDSTTPFFTGTDAILMDEKVTEEEEIKAALNILDHFEEGDEEHLDGPFLLYAYLYVLATLGITPEEFNPEKMADCGLKFYMENFG